MQPLRIHVALDSIRRGRQHGSLLQRVGWQLQSPPPLATRAYSSLSEHLHRELTSRHVPLAFDYMHPQPSHLLNLTLFDLLPAVSSAPGDLPSVRTPPPLSAGHHLVYFPPQVSLSQLLPDGTDTLHTPGSPFNRRLWAGGRVRFLADNSLCLDGSRAVCLETIRDVTVTGQPGDERVNVRIERRIGTVQEDEDQRSIRERLWKEDADEAGQSSIIEDRSLVFMRDNPSGKLTHDKACFDTDRRAVKSPSNPYFRHSIIPNKALLFRFSALTFNAHAIHIDETYTRNVECYRDLLVHGPLTLTLLLTALQASLSKLGLAISEIYYKNIAPLYVEEELAICGKPKMGKHHTAWDVWIEGTNGRLAVRVQRLLDYNGPVLGCSSCHQSVLVHGGLLNGYYVVFQRHFVFKFLPEIWRLFSPFMITGPGISLIFDVYFMYTYGSQLETGSSRLSAPGDFVTYLFFVASVIVLTAGCLLNCITFTSALILACVYTFSQDNRGRKVTFFVVQIPVEFLPWAMLTWTLVTSGWPAALRDSTGIAAAHAYDFITRIYPTFGGGRNHLITPVFISQYFAAQTPRPGPRAYGTVFRAADQAQNPSSGGWASSFQSPWNRRGPGRRLGGD
ncbi:DER1-domain-containing protein [Aspergillus heteromorphus CBS 117.55]|uniref:DER1-domain-containing protein n=1 Tax=Aspergillus heteromorphus CBS 117.55 TaxID=1448321 RepID=A0A317USL0_9EURO|nr:DER1-domain-containing protein [Aspergillus heteromorphus CBS 117.55]PWY64984.1 DER1-domain-containing protein [Aspergillus heteromorphus CBS 117.55]